MSAVEELDTLLQSLRAFKPPGITKSKIEAITSICVVNVQYESLLAQKIFTHFKKTPYTHKLGVLYVVDSVTRQWVEKARQGGQNLDSGVAQDGSYAAGVHRMTELLPTMMNDIIQCAPEDQKEKIRKLVDIWERGNTFPMNMLADFKEKIAKPNEYTFTPPGSPPVTAGAASAASQSIQGQIAPANAGAASAQTAPAGASAILAALASMGKQAATAPPPTNYPAPSIQSVPAAYNPPVQPQVTPHIPQSTPMQNLPAQASSTTGAYGQTPQQLGVPPNQPNPPVAAAVNPLALIAGLMQQAQAQQVQAPQVVAPSNDAMALQLQLLQGLASGQVPQEQIPQVLAALGISQNSAAPAINSAVPNYPLQNNQLSRDAYGSSGGYDQARYRDRSRSPESRYRNVSPPARRDSPTYGVYKAQSDAYGNDRRGKVAKGRSTRTDYRQRSPVGRGGRQETPTSSSRAPQTKWIEYDQSMPEGHIKVLSRTLFVGGVTGTEAELRAIFGRYGEVQSCIVNHEKRHAFVKMVGRDDAVTAKTQMEDVHDSAILSKARSTRWGVGFGPRECSDYNSGVSIIPINCLTDADRKWMVSAEFGGTGGKPIEGGMVVEEPDIEIGAGVSSKAISKRVGPDQGSRRGGHNTGSSRGSDQNGGARSRQDNSAGGSVPAVPGFGFDFSGAARTQY